jgi:large subunit ribosomal protein L13
MTKHTIDAKGRKPGRIATEVAVLLMGKNRTDFAKNTIPAVSVEVENAGGMILDAKKMIAKEYVHHSGYPGALKVRSMAQVVAKHGAGEILRRAVYGMLPKNKLRPKMMLNLKIKD